jgi:hypothetical protein
VGRQFRATQWKWVEGKEQMTGRSFPARERTGYLRLARRGAVLAYLVADEPGTDFTLLHEHAITTEPVRRVRLSALTAGPQGALDVRFTDLRIDASALPDSPPAPPRRLAWKLGLVLALLAVLATGIWLAARRARRRRPARAAPREG